MKRRISPERWGRNILYGAGFAISVGSMVLLSSALDDTPAPLNSTQVQGEADNLSTQNRVLIAVSGMVLGFATLSAGDHIKTKRERLYDEYIESLRPPAETYASMPMATSAKPHSGE